MVTSFAAFVNTTSPLHSPSSNGPRTVGETVPSPVETVKLSVPLKFFTRLFVFVTACMLIAIGVPAIIGPPIWLIKK